VGEVDVDAAVRWTEVTEEGFRGGPVMPPSFDGSAAASRAAEAERRARRHLGTLVADDRRSSVIFLPLLDKDPRRARASTTTACRASSRTDIRAKYEQRRPGSRCTSSASPSSSAS
jgi:hypothetical protein